ncbi:acyltransferase-domain-containing protein [Lipomyces oligophaga]|uniref:acyltransferase-domain-containing protein n=1 Tax=Lipomyces oligophaga TaxID=45792 RepID=UPI0034CF0E46
MPTDRVLTAEGISLTQFDQLRSGSSSSIISSSDDSPSGLSLISSSTVIGTPSFSTAPTSRSPSPPPQSTALSQQHPYSSRSGSLIAGRMSSRSAAAGVAAIKPKKPALVQFFRAASVAVYFTTCVLTINFTQLLGLPLRIFSKDWFHAYRDYTKQSFGLVINTTTQWWSPTPVVIVGDSTVAGLLKKNDDGTLETSFGDRVVLLANHQIYSDWLYLWWVAYTNRMHGGFYIFLKESLKNIPFIGWGMMYFKFIFLSRKWQTDQARMESALQEINAEKDWPAWLLIFPEGTNFTQNGIDKSHAYAEKFNMVEPKNMLLPRARGLYFILKNFDVPYIYDCTTGFEGVPPAGFAQDYFTLSSIYAAGLPPKSIHMHWRRFARSDIPLDDESEFERWLQKRWLEKDQLLENYYLNGHFDGETVINTEIRLRKNSEILQVCAIPAVFALCANLAYRAWHLWIQ